MTARHRLLFETVADVTATEDAWLHGTTRELRGLVPRAVAATGYVYEGPSAPGFPAEEPSLFEGVEGALASFVRSGEAVGTLLARGARYVVVHGAATPIGGAVFVVEHPGDRALPPKARWLLHRFADELVLALRRRRALSLSTNATLRALARAEVVTAWDELMAGRGSVLGIARVGSRRLLVIARCATGQQRRLSPVESQVAQAVARGESNKAIGFALDLAASTVACHLRSVVRKLRLRSRLELVHVQAAVEAATLTACAQPDRGKA